MKRILASLLALWFGYVPAHAGSMTLLGAGSPSVAVGSPIVAPVMMVGPYTPGPSISAINYIGLLGGGGTGAWSPNGVQRVDVWPVVGTLSGLTVNYPAGAGAAGTYAISLRQNGANSTTMTCIIPNGGTTCNAVASVNVLPGDLLGWQSCPGTVSAGTCTTGGTETSNGPVQISAVFTSTNNNESFLIGSGATGGATTTAPTYLSFGGYVANYGATEATVSNYSPTAGVIDRLYINASAAPGASKFWYATLFKNGTATSLQCSMTGTGSGVGITNCNDPTSGHAVTIVATDLFSVELCPTTSATYPGTAGCTGGSVNTALFQAGVRFVPTTPGETIITGIMVGAPSTSVTNYLNWNGQIGANATESYLYSLAPSISGGFTFKKLYAIQTPQPGSGVTRTFNIRSNGASVGSPSAVSCTMAAGTGASQSCNDTTNSYSSIAANALLDFQTTVSGTNTALTSLKISGVLTSP